MSIHPKVFINHTKEPLHGSKFNYTADLERYERDWVPKIKAYNAALEAAIPKQYLAPEALVPSDLNTGHFNATTIPEKILDEQTLAITGLTATDIAKNIAAKKLTAVEVITAFIKRATIAHQFTDCALEILFEDGLERAKYLDDYYAKTGKLVGPLHGVPVSLKEHYNYEGRVTHGGFVSALDNVTDKFSLTNQIIYDCGAVFYIRTNEPQCLMHLDSINNISKRCKNPYNTSVSPGGSSSGEGALIGIRGSPLGIGSDIGGSIRTPSAFNGIWGLKPSTKRLSLLNCFFPSIDTFQEAIGPVLGPMANSAEDLELFMESYISKQPWLEDQHCIPLPWRKFDVPKPSDLTIGIVFDDGVVKPHPPILRALKEAEAKLKAAGVNVIVWEPHRVYEAAEIANAAYTADGNYAAVNRLAESGEPAVPLSEHYLSMGKGDQGLSTLELEFYVNTREVLRQEYLELFNSRGVDFILAPTYVGTAPKPSTVKYWGYTSLWNILDYTTLVLPSGVFGDQEQDLKDKLYKPRNKYEEYEYGLYDPEASDGMPVGLSLVGRRYTEEPVLKAGKVIHEIISV